MNIPKDRPRDSYYCVLKARAGRKSFVGEDGSISDEQHLRMIDWALRSYFMMNRGKKPSQMGSKKEFISELKDKGDRVVVVVSAMGDTTDYLIGKALEITDRPDLREFDALLSTGEQMSMALLALVLESEIQIMP